MSILNARNSSFYFKLPVGFITEEVEQKFLPYLKRISSPYRTVSDYLSSTIQNVGIPGMTHPTAQQAFPTGQKINWRGSINLNEAFDKNITLTFKLTEGFINYFMLLESSQRFLDGKNEVEFLPAFTVSVVDWYGYTIATVKFTQVVWTKLDSIGLAYNDVGGDFKTFNADFSYNYINFNISDPAEKR